MAYRRNLYSYENYHRISRRLVQVKTENSWENYARMLYMYDRMNRESSRINQIFEDGIWKNSAKRMFSYLYEHHVKVEICHKGVPICVSHNAVKAHLAHGDNFVTCGPCVKRKHGSHYKSGLVDQGLSDESEGLRIYPVPFQNFLNIDLGDDSPVSQVELFDLTGRKVYMVDGISDSSIRIPADDLPAGIFILRLTGDEVSVHYILHE
jgi:hypothetical protein